MTNVASPILTASELVRPVLENMPNADDLGSALELAISEQILERLYTAAETVPSDLDKAFLQEVKSLGCYPIQIATPRSEDERKEKLLRKRLNKQKPS